MSETYVPSGDAAVDAALVGATALDEAPLPERVAALAAAHEALHAALMSEPA